VSLRISTFGADFDRGRIVQPFSIKVFRDRDGVMNDDHMRRYCPGHEGNAVNRRLYGFAFGMTPG
jgi:hypothetical protein